MNLTVKRCLLGLVVSTTMFGIARAQEPESVGTVQIGPKAQVPVQSSADGQTQIPVQTDVPPAPGVVNFPASPTPLTGNFGQPIPSGNPNPTTKPGQPGYGNFFRTTPVDQVFVPRFTISSLGGGLYGYNAGYSNLGMFAPYKLDDTAILFATGLGMVTYDGRGGGTVGVGWRYFMEDLDRIVGLSTFYDFDNGHAKPYQQVGLSFESLGRYTDFRMNGYIPVSNPDHVLQTGLTGNSELIGNGIGLFRNNTVEQAYTGFDAEVGGPTPILGRYGLNCYVGGYYFGGMGQVGGTTTGVSGRLLAQINEDVSFGVQVTNDHLFGLNTQFQVFMNLPNGRPSRWMRNLKVEDRMVQNVYRQYRVMAHTSSFTTFDQAIDPNTNKPYFVANINPNLSPTTAGDGSIGNPFPSIAAYEAQTIAQQKRFDIIYVQPRTDKSDTQLDTHGVNGTLDIYNNQRLLSTTVAQTFTAANLPGQTFTLGGFTGGSAPMLFNSAGGDVVTLVGGNTQVEQVSGFSINGGFTGNGIRGNGNTAVSIINNTITNGLNGVLLTNLSGTIAAGTNPQLNQLLTTNLTGLPGSGTEAQFFNNTIQNNVGNGIQVTNHGSPPLDVIVQNNTISSNGVIDLPKGTVLTAPELAAITTAGGTVVTQSDGTILVTIPLSDGLQLNAQAGSRIGGIIGGMNTAAVLATATTAAVPAITLSNTFNANTGNGLNLTANGGTLNFTNAAATPTFGIINNTFTANVLDGLHIDTTNNSIAAFNVINNFFGLSNSSTSGNQRFGIGLVSDSGNTTINIGGEKSIDTTTGVVSDPGNTFNFNTVSAINLAVTGSSVFAYNIDNNTINNATSATIAAPHDEFTFAFNGTSGTAPFVISNLSDSGVTISSVSWNLAGTAATIAATSTAVVQPISDTFLTKLNNLPVIAGSSPLLITSTGLVANNANSGLATGSQLIPLGFTGFGTGSTFSATSQFQQAGGSSALTSAATVGSSVTVNFSNGLSSTQKLALEPTVSSVAVGATGNVFGTTVPGFGSGSDGIHVSAGGASTVTSSLIQNNTVTGYGATGIHVETAGTANAANVVIENNTVQNNGTGVNGAGQNVFTGSGVQITRNDSSTLDVLLTGNTITSNFNNGLTISGNGTAVGSFVVNSSDNNISNNAGNGLNVSIAGAEILTYTSNRDNFNGNGGGSGKNPVATGGDNITLATTGTSVANINLNNVFANAATGNGLSAASSLNSTLNLAISSPTDPLATGASSFSNNTLSGIVLTSNDTSLMNATISTTQMNNNAVNGIAFNRNGASLILANISNSSLNSNGANGLFYLGIGSDPTNPNQPHSGTSNLINLTGDTLNNNGSSVSGTGDGANVEAFGQSGLVMNALATTFNDNFGNGIHVDETPGAAFGNVAAAVASNFDNVDFIGNGANGIVISSQMSNAPLGDAASRTLFNLNSVQGDTIVANNGGDGILMQYQSGIHNVTIRGDGNPTPIHQTVIQNNGLKGTIGMDGIHADIGNFANTTVTVDTVLIGGATTALGNKGDGISFDTVMFAQLPAGNTIANYEKAGTGTLNVNKSVIENNVGNGITLYGNGLDGSGFGTIAATYSQRTTNTNQDGFGQINANVTNNMIVNNGQSGVSIELLGRMGGNRSQLFYGGPPGLDKFTFTNNVISNNGNYGLFYESNAAIQPNFAYLFFSPPPPPGVTNFPLQPTDLSPAPGFNYSLGVGTGVGQIDGVKDAQVLSDWLLLATVSNSQLTMTNNTIQGNGQNHDLSNADAVKLRIGTDSYLSADLQGNNLTGNVGSSLRIESFVNYNPVTFVAEPVPASSQGSATTLSTAFLDPTAQLDLRLNNNTGNTINIVDPLINSTGTLPGNASGNGAVYPFEGLKDRFATNNPTKPERLTQLFQLDNGTNVNTQNNFISNGVTQNLLNAFYQGDFWNRAAADPLFPNPAFPQDSTVNPGNPFLP